MPVVDCIHWILLNNGWRLVFMKKSIALGLAVFAMSLNSLTSFAAADEKYPASSFEPSVTYIDESATQASSTATSAQDDKYPASNFQPKVTYIDEEAAGQPQLTKAAVIDEKYPAANFESKVIYVDENAVTDEVSEQTDPKYPAAYFKPKIIYP
jgi:disulfide oxidoreductase YuzD